MSASRKAAQGETFLELRGCYLAFRAAKTAVESGTGRTEPWRPDTRWFEESRDALLLATVRALLELEERS